MCYGLGAGMERTWQLLFGHEGSGKIVGSLFASNTNHGKVCCFYWKRRWTIQWKPLKKRVVGTYTVWGCMVGKMENQI